MVYAPVGDCRIRIFRTKTIFWRRLEFDYDSEVFAPRPPPPPFSLLPNFTTCPPISPCFSQDHNAIITHTLQNMLCHIQNHKLFNGRKFLPHTGCQGQGCTTRGRRHARCHRVQRWESSAPMPHSLICKHAWLN